MTSRAQTYISLGEGWEGELYRQWDFPPDAVRKWNEIAYSSGDRGIFISYDWFSIWWEAFGGGTRPFVAILRKHGEVKAVFPCCSKTGPGREGDGLTGRQIKSLTNSHTYYFDFIVDPGSRREALSCFLALLGKAGNSPYMFIENLPAPCDNAASFLKELGRSGTPFHHYSQPWAPWTESSGDWAEFQKDLPGRLRNTLRRHRKKAEAIGGLTFDAIEQSDRLDELLDIMFGVEYRSWKGRTGTAIKCRKETEDFYRRIAHWAMERKHLLLFILSLGGTPIASNLCLCSGRTVFLLKSGYDESFSSFSPGNLLHFEVFNYLYKKPGLSIYNFLGACDPWKMEWTRKTESAGWIKIYPKSLGGWSRYAFQYGWKEFLKRSDTIRQLRIWMKQRAG